MARMIRIVYSMAGSVPALSQPKRNPAKYSCGSSADCDVDLGLGAAATTYTRQMDPDRIELDLPAHTRHASMARAVAAALGADAVVLDELRGCIDATLRAGCQPPK